MEAGSDARSGRTFGKYTLERVIGTGGMSTVYEARHHNGHRVAVKLLKPELSINAEVRARFLREGYAANRVDHPGVVRILDDHSTEDGAVFLVLELLEGETLAARTKAAGKMPCRFVVDVGCQLLRVLAAAHAAGVIHRDVKPENVMLQPDGTIKVLDFGIAQIRDPAQSTATATGRMLGTPAFMPPEQAYGRRREIDERSDIWAVGATLFTMLAGRVVHQATTAEETLVKAATEEPPPLRSVIPELSPAIASVIDRALVREKDGRWASADAMLAALERAATAAAPRSRARLFLVAGVGAVAATWFALRPAPVALASEETPREARAALEVAPAIVTADLPSAQTTTSTAPREPEPRKPMPPPPPASVVSEARPTPFCGFEIDEEGRRWPRRCPAAP